MSQQLTLHQAFAAANKSLSNPPSIQPDPRKKQLLRKKRNLEIIERNYLIRRFYYPIKQNSEYEIEAKTYSILNHFDFDSPPYNKFSSIKNISANAFWFLLCSNYFPYYSNELIDQKECIPEELKKLIDYINNNNNIKKNSTNFGEKFNFLRNLKSVVNSFIKKKNNLNEKNNLFQTTNINTSLKSNNINSFNNINLNENKSNVNLSNLSCTNNISSIKSLLENLIKYFENKNENIPNKIKNDYLLTKNYNRDIRVEEDFELDIKFHTKSFKRFREEILDKVEKNEEDENDDIVCYVCGDGEYEDDNLILYCSKCNMTVHQKCYGVLVIPEEDWICHLCKSFNDINYCNNMECILCPNLGGAMKPCTLRKSSHSYKIMIKNRKCPFLRDNINKNNNLNNNLINSISDENKDNKIMENKNNNNLKNESHGNGNNIHESNLFISDINNSNSNTKSLVPPNGNSITKIIDNNINLNTNNNNYINNDLNTNSNNNNLLTNSPNNNSNHSNNTNNENNINALQNNIMEASCRSSNINKDTDSLMSNISSNKINIKEGNEINNNSPNQINNNDNKNILKKQSQKSKSQNEIYLSEKIAHENAWVHLSCALWHQELIIANFDLKEKIKGVENLPKKRLLEQCNICLKSGYGPTIKCEKCDYHFHPECARRLKNFFLEINENENGETTFLAYCNKDAPPQHLKKYELIRQRKRDDIKKFSSLLQKDISSLNKISDDKQYNIFHPYCYNTNNIEMKKIINEEKKIIKKIGKSNNSIENHNNFLYNKDILFNESTKKNNSNSYNFDKGIELSISEKKSLLNTIREMLIEQSNLTLEINTDDYSIKSNNNIKITYDDLQYPEKFSWLFLKESQYYLNGISNYETFKIFQSLIPNKIDYAKNILKEKIITPEKQKKHKNKIKHKKRIKEEKNIKYCICNKNENNNNNNWIGCENDNGKCPGKGWYHITCIPELKNYNIDSFSQYFEHYYCPECRKLFKFENEIKKGDEVNEINVELNPEEKYDIDINIESKEKSSNDLELKKQESNVLECVNIDNHEEKLEEKDNNNMNNNINNNGELPMEIEEKIKEEIKENKEVKIN